MTSCVAQKMPGTPPLAAGPPLFLAAAGPLSLQRLEPPAADRLVDQLAQIALAEDERLLIVGFAGSWYSHHQTRGQRGARDLC